MPKAIDLLRQGRDEELWQMCCGFLSLNIDEFMEIQERLLLSNWNYLINVLWVEKSCVAPAPGPSRSSGNLSR